MSTHYIICEEEVGTHEDILYPPPYDTREEAEKALKRLDDNPRCEIVFYIKEFTYHPKQIVNLVENRRELRGAFKSGIARRTVRVKSMLP